jgi:UDP-N-acetylglucosamine 2-epimerase (non-hydrolysing)
MEFLNLWKDAAIVLTDSGGLQEEPTALGVPCVTLRENTESSITLTEGTNVLAGITPDNVVRVATQSLSKGRASGHRPALWDGRAATRIVDVLARELD